MNKFKEHNVKLGDIEKADSTIDFECIEIDENCDGMVLSHAVLFYGRVCARTQNKNDAINTINSDRKRIAKTN